METYDAVVVGSGFGGAVAAARLSQAGLRVAVLERGRRWRPGTFPRDERLRDGWLWGKGRGLYDVRWLDQMVSVEGAGWGGGSLVYANVFARPPAAVFNEGWPVAHSRTSFDPYYDLAAHMLEVRPVSTNPPAGRVPARTSSVEAAVAGMNRAAGTVRPLLAVQFTQQPELPLLNRHGATQHGCSFVAECVLGCNQGAKNSLDHNYLHIAEREGAVAHTECEATGISSVGGSYQIEYLDHRTAKSTVVTAPTVFMAAGAIGTTELLLRCRDTYQTLPELSRTLGDSFSGNGDFLAFIRRPRSAIDPDEAPTITTTSIVDCEIDGARVWFQVQDGSYPRQLSALVAASTPGGRLWSSARRFLGGHLHRPGTGPRTRTPGRRNVMTLLVMGRDESDGRLRLDHHDEARVEWDFPANQALYRAEGRAARDVARQLGGRPLFLPASRFLRQAVTVHALGGTRMGADAGSGVIDHHGEVHGYPGMFVVDGAAVPAATGVNPSATIAALAEQTVEYAVRRLTGDQRWQAPEWPAVRPGPVPEDAAERHMARSRSLYGQHQVAFREHLTGAVTSRHGDPRPFSLHLDAHVPDLARFLSDPRHPVQITGRIHLQGSPDSAVTGTLSLFPDDGHAAMTYLLTFHDRSGQPWRLRGHKRVTTADPLSLWRALTTLHLSLTGPASSDALSGQAHISPMGAARLLSTVRGENYRHRSNPAAVVAFGRFFLRRVAAAARRSG